MDNNKKELLSYLYNNSSFRIFLSAYITIKESNEINKILKINYNYEELEAILKLNDPEIIKFLYFNRYYVHQILYEEEKEITIINSDENVKNIFYIFYLSLLIRDNIDIINYSYKFDYIREIDNYYRNEKDKYLLIIASKIIIDLISNFEGTEYYDKNVIQKEINNVIEERKNIIKSSINIFNEITLNINEKNILSKNIDEIYIEIIKALFKSKKIDDYTYTYNIINQLDLENIYITQTMYNGISELLNSNEDYINDYLINNKEDLFNEKKINFYYILLKYILKSSIYIYQIPFLNVTRKNILKIIKSKEDLNFIINIKDYNKYKFIYIIKTFLDSEYYYSKSIPKSDLIKINEVLNYYKEYLFESKKEDIKIIENIINNNKGFYYIYLYDYDIAEKMNKRIKIIKYLYNKINNINDENKIKEEEINQYINKWNNYEKIIKNKEFNKLDFEKNEKLIIEYFNNINNKEDLLKIFSEEEYYNFLNLKNDSNKKNSKGSGTTINISKNNQKFPLSNENEINYKANESKNQSINHSNNIEQINPPHNNSSNNIQQSNSSNNIQQSNSSNNIPQNNSSNNIQQNNSSNNIQQNNSSNNIQQNNSSNNIQQNNSSIYYQQDYFNQDQIGVNNINENNQGLISPAFNSNIPNDSQLFNNSIYNNNDLSSRRNFLNEEIMTLNFDDIQSDIDIILKKSTLCIEVNTMDREFKYKEKLIYENKNNNEDYKKLAEVIDKFKDEDLFGYKNYFILRDSFIEFVQFIENIKKIILKDEFKNKLNFEIILDFIERNENYEKEKKKLKIIDCKYSVNCLNINKNENIYEDKDILNNKEIKNFITFLNKINYNINSFLSISSITSINNYGTSSSSQDIYKLFLNNLKKASPYKIIEFIRIIGKHKTSAQYIKELNKKYFISGGPFDFFLYQNLTFIMEKEYKLEHYSIYPDSKLNNKDEIDLIICTNDKIKKLTIKNNDLPRNIIDFFGNISNVKALLKIYKSSIIICGEKGIFLINDFVEKIIELRMYKISGKSFSNGIKINNTISAFTSNQILMNGFDHLILYNNNSKKIIENIYSYSFILSQNNLAVIPGEESKVNNKILLCACKKYIKGQKNGILLVTLQINDKKISNNFYDTGNFEIYCFCPILLVNNSFKIKEDYSFEETEYFFVGGYDNNKKEGLIKLYQIIYNEENFEKTKIKYIQDIIIEKDIKSSYNYFNGFDGPITCITQSKYSGNILITCFDGNVYLFTKPNINGLSLFKRKRKKKKKKKNSEINYFN